MPVCVKKTQGTSVYNEPCFLEVKNRARVKVLKIDVFLLRATAS